MRWVRDVVWGTIISGTLLGHSLLLVYLVWRTTPDYPFFFFGGVAVASAVTWSALWGFSEWWEKRG